MTRTPVAAARTLKPRHHRTRLLTVVASIIFPLQAPAAEPDTFGVQQTLATLDSLAMPQLGDTATGYVEDQYTYDNNLFRLPNDVTNLQAQIGPNASRQDRLNSGTIGGFGQWLVQRPSSRGASTRRRQSL